MLKFIAQLNCGCCDTTMQFHSQESAQAAFSAAGMTTGASITDDAGEVHEGIDTFYGFRQEDEERRGLLFLVDQFNKQWSIKSTSSE